MSLRGLHESYDRSRELSNSATGLTARNAARIRQGKFGKDN